MAKLTTPQIAGDEVKGERVTIRGRVLDADGNGIPDAMLETWQANAHGKYDHPEDTQDKPLQPGFKGWGRIPTDADGGFSFTTLKPGGVPGPGGQAQAPHIAVAVGMRGLLKHLVTRIYFPDDPANEADPILNLVEPARRPTLIAKTVPGQAGLLEWNVICAGDAETVFFDY